MYIFPFHLVVLFTYTHMTWLYADFNNKVTEQFDNARLYLSKCRQQFKIIRFTSFDKFFKSILKN